MLVVFNSNDLSLKRIFEIGGLALKM